MKGNLLILISSFCPSDDENGRPMAGKPLCGLGLGHSGSFICSKTVTTLEETMSLQGNCPLTLASRISFAVQADSGTDLHSISPVRTLFLSLSLSLSLSEETSSLTT